MHRDVTEYEDKVLFWDLHAAGVLVQTIVTSELREKYGIVLRCNHGNITGHVRRNTTTLRRFISYPQGDRKMLMRLQSNKRKVYKRSVVGQVNIADWS